MHKKLFTLVKLLLLIQTLTSYASQEPKSNYYHARSLYEQQSYTKAELFFKNILHTSSLSSKQPLISFYYALTAFHTHHLDTAIERLHYIIKQFPQWHQIDEVRYWLAYCFFLKQLPINGIEQLSYIKKRSFKKAIKQLRKRFLTPLTRPTLITLVRAYPNDKLIHTIYAHRFKNHSVQSNSIPSIKYRGKNNFPYETSFKVEFNIAILFPFFIKDISPTNMPNNFVYDLYRGMKLSSQNLLNRGIRLNLYAYDTKRDEETTRKILKLGELKKMDLIIGPLYPIPIELTAKFATKHRIYMINPLSSNEAIFKQSPYALLLNPSWKTQSEVAAKYILQEIQPALSNWYSQAKKLQTLIEEQKKVEINESNNIEDTGSTNPKLEEIKKIDQEKPLLIIYGDSREDKIRKEHFQGYLNKQLAFPLINTLNLNKGMIQSILYKVRTYIKNLKTKNEKIPIPGFIRLIQSAQRIYIISNDELVVSNILSVIEELNKKAHTLGHTQWLNSKAVDLNQLERLRVTLIGPKLLNSSTLKYKKVTQHYINAYARIPSENAFWGYEIADFIGESLYLHGTHFPEFWSQHQYFGKLFNGFFFEHQKDNQLVAMAKLNSTTGMTFLNNMTYSTRPYLAKKYMDINAEQQPY